MQCVAYIILKMQILLYRLIQINTCYKIFKLFYPQRQVNHYYLFEVATRPALDHN